MKKILIILLLSFFLFTGCSSPESAGPLAQEVEAPPVPEPEPLPGEIQVQEPKESPKLAIWLAKKDEVIESQKPYSLIMSAWFEPQEADQMRAQNPDMLLLAGLTTNWIYDHEGWKEFLLTVASHNQDTTYKLTDQMYLKNSSGEKCAFGWESDEWNHDEIYSMDPRNPEWKELIVSFYSTVLEQPQHDGIIVDMVVEEQYWCPGSISREEWISATKQIMEEIQEKNTQSKLVIFNAGLQYEDLDEFKEDMDGYVLENFLVECGASYEQGLAAAETPYIVVYAVDTDDSGLKDLNRMRLGLTLSLLNDNTYFAYDFGPRDHGQAWWFPEYDVDLGEPLGVYYEKDGAYWREFENGVVVSSPNKEAAVEFETEYIDATTGISSKTFVVEAGDGRIYLEE